MTLLEWRDEFRIGIDGVDDEHRALIDQINAVYALIDERAGRQQVIDSLGEIYGNIAAHFALEERMMRRHGYPDYEQHQRDHERLLDEIGAIADDFEATEALDDAGFKGKLGDWFQLHFKTHDARLHQLPTMRKHDAVSQNSLKTWIRDARNRFINRG